MNTFSHHRNGNVLAPVQQNDVVVLRKVRLSQAQRRRLGAGRNVLFRSMRGKIFRSPGKGGRGAAKGQRGATGTTAEFDGNAERDWRQRVAARADIPTLVRKQSR